MRTPIDTGGIAAVAAGLVMAGLLTPHVHGQTFTWDGGGATNNWSEAANWTGISAPPAGGASTVALTFALGSTNFTPNNNLGTFELDTMLLAGSTNPYTISGNALTFTGATRRISGLSGPHVVNNAIIVNQSLEASSSGILELNGNLSGAADITKTGGGTLVLDGTNSGWTGDLNINSGTIRFDPGNSLGNDTLVNIALGATADFSPEGELFGGFTGSGHIELGNTINFIPIFDTDQVFFGTINGPGADFEKEGAATLFLVNNTSILVDRLNLDAGRIEFSIGNMTVTSGTDVAAGTELEIISGSFNPGALTTVLGTMTVGQGSAITPAAGSSIFVNDTGTLSVTDGQVGFLDTLVSINRTTFTTGGATTTLSNGVTVQLQGTMDGFSPGEMNTSNDVEVIGGASLDVLVGGRANITGGLHVGTGSDGTVFADGDFFGPSVANGMIDADDAASRWGEDGGAADLTFQDGADGFFADVDMARSTTADTTATLTLLTGGDVFINSLRMADLGGASTSAQILIGENSDLTVLGPLAAIGHPTEGSADIEITGVGSEADFSGATTTVHATGSIHVSNDGEFIITENLTLSGGTLEVNTGGFFTVNGAADVFNLGGRVSGNGAMTFNVGGELHNDGTVAPGDSTGVLNVTGGDYEQTAGGTLEIEIGGLTVGTQHDRLAIIGDAALAGTLDVTLINNFTPNLADMFTILTATNVTGTFDNIDAPIFNGLTFDAIYNPASVVLQVINAPVLLGDANNDGQVTGADLISVQQNFGNVGPTPLLGDANNDGQVTGADLISVQQNFGNVLTPTNTTIPEPAMFGLIGVLVCAGSLKRPDGSSTSAARNQAGS